ncbi:MAG: hypothetical protein QGI83_10970, partial [Candidatus Latescibacteria bacterium]|nr:hypothetical protein [Candidatus Latescibacterota bacterium]
MTGVRASSAGSGKPVGRLTEPQAELELRGRGAARWVSVCPTLVLALGLTWFAVPASGQVAGCVVCHGKPDLKRVEKSGRTRSLYVEAADIDASVHTGKACIDCHVDVVEIPHSTPPQHVNCTQCHFKGNTEGAPQSDIYQEYKDSVHGEAVAEGHPKAPACQDCHGSHRILGHLDPDANVARPNVSKTCGRCHLEIFSQFRASVHGVDLTEGNPDVPTCTGCHNEHGIRSHDDPESPTNTANISRTCSSCHAVEGIVGKYGISTGQVETYEESFHGVAI